MPITQFETQLTEEEGVIKAPTVNRAAELKELRPSEASLPISLEDTLKGDRLAAAALKCLNSDQTDQLITIWEKIENQPGSKEDLILLLKRQLNSGPLSGESALLAHLPGEDSLLDHLHALSTETSSVDIFAPHQDKILSGLIKECSDPANVVQGWVPGCVPVEVCHPLVESNTAEYGRLVKERALTGQMTLADGRIVKGNISEESLKEEKEIKLMAARVIDQFWQSGHVTLADSDHTIFSFQGLTKQKAVDLLVSRIDDGRDERPYSGRIVHDALTGENKWRGLLSQQTEAYMESVHSTNIRRLDYWNRQDDRGQAEQEIFDNMAAGRRVSATVLDESDGAHQVGLVNTFQRGGVDYVIIRDPRGAGGESEILSGLLPRTRCLEEENGLGQVNCGKDQWIVKMSDLVPSLDRMFIYMGDGPDAQVYAGAQEPLQVPGRTERFVPEMDLTERSSTLLSQYYRDLIDILFMEQMTTIT